MSGSSGGGVTSPQALANPRNDAVDQFAKMLMSSLGSGGNIGELLRQIGQTAAYPGQINAPATSGQNNALGAANAVFSRIFGGAGGGSGGQPGGPSSPTFTPPPGWTPNGPPIPSNTMQHQGPAFQDQTPVTVNGKQTTIADYMKAVNTPGTPEFQAYSPPGYSFYNGAWVNDSSLEMAGLKQPGVSLPKPGDAGSAPAAPTGPSAGMTPTAALTSPIASTGLAPLAPSASGGTTQIGTGQIQNPTPLPTPLPPGGTPAAGGTTPAGTDPLAAIFGGGTGQTMLPGFDGQPFGSQQGSDYLMSLTKNPAAASLLGGGQSTDLNTLGGAISAATQPGLDRNVRDLREQFSTAGLRNGTDINAGVSDLMARNQSQITGQVAGLIPQIQQNANSTSLGALGTLGGIGSSLGTLGQGDLSSRIASLLLPGQLAQQNYSLNSQAQGTDQASLDRQYQAWLQQQGLTPQIMSFLGTTPATQYGPSLLSQGTNAVGTGLAAYSAAKGSK